MKLTRVERWMLANQHRILEKLDSYEAARHKKAYLALEAGYEKDYPEIASRTSDEAMSEKECEEVWEILDMHRCLHDSYGRLTDKSGVSAESIRFGGFDNNNEHEQLSYAMYIAPEGSGKYEELNICDSHGQTLHRYRAMLKKWNASKDKHLLTKEEIIAITTV